ncbi:hypothetical protein ACV56Z_15245 [Staphylococcus aureus]
MQQPITPLLFMANGPSFVADTTIRSVLNVKLKRMGANIEVDEGTATINHQHYMVLKFMLAI